MSLRVWCLESVFFYLFIINCAQQCCDRRSDLIYDLNWSVGFHLFVNFLPVLLTDLCAQSVLYSIPVIISASEEPEKKALYRQRCSVRVAASIKVTTSRWWFSACYLGQKAQGFVGGAVRMDLTERSPRASIKERYTQDAETRCRHILLKFAERFLLVTFHLWRNHWIRYNQNNLYFIYLYCISVFWNKCLLMKVKCCFLID